MAKPVIKNKAFRQLVGNPKKGKIIIQSPIKNNVFSFLIPLEAGRGRYHL